MSAFLKNRELANARVSGREAVEVTLQAGARDLIRTSSLNLALADWVSGDWDEVEALYAQYHDDLTSHQLELAMYREVLVPIRSARGEPVDFDLEVPEFDATDEQGLSISTWMKAVAAEVDGDAEQAALLFARATDAAYRAFGIDDDFPVLWPLAVESVLAVGDTSEAARLVGLVADAPMGVVTPLAHAHLLRLRALIGIAHGDDPATVDADLDLATEEFRDFGARFYLARTLLERARQMGQRGDVEGAAPVLEEAEAIFVDLRADRWVAETRGVSSLR
jgi:hypothetical protein